MQNSFEEYTYFINIVGARDKLYKPTLIVDSLFQYNKYATAPSVIWKHECIARLNA